MKTMMEALIELDACDLAKAWLEDNKIEDFRTAWIQCHRGDWMSWLLDKVARVRLTKEFEAAREVYWRTIGDEHSLEVCQRIWADCIRCAIPWATLAPHLKMRGLDG